MTMNQSSTEVMRDEILSHARRESEEIIKRAREEADILLKKASAEADQVRKELLERARADAAHQSMLIVATVPVETGRLRAARIDALLESVHEEAFQRLLGREGFDYRKSLTILASDAISRMEGTTFVVKLAEIDQTTLIDGLSDEIAQHVGRPVNITVSHGPGITGGGIIIEDAEARQVWDNCLMKRLERLWPELRRQIAVQAGLTPQTGSRGDSP